MSGVFGCTILADVSVVGTYGRGIARESKTEIVEDIVSLLSSPRQVTGIKLRGIYIWKPTGFRQKQSKKR